MAEKTCLTQYATKGERRMARLIVAEILSRGGVISVNDGAEWPVRGSVSPVEILGALCSTDADTLHWANPTGARVGWLWLVWGNADDGSELIADYSANDETEAVYRAICPNPE